MAAAEVPAAAPERGARGGTQPRPVANIYHPEMRAIYPGRSVEVVQRVRAFEEMFDHLEDDIHADPDFEHFFPMDTDDENMSDETYPP